MSLNLEKLATLDAAMTPGEWWVLPDETGHHVLIGDQEDRVCVVHNGECRPRENAEGIATIRNALSELLRLSKLAAKYETALMTIAENTDVETGQFVDAEFMGQTARTALGG